MPPDMPEKAIVCPFGDHAMCDTEPTPGTRTRRSMLAEFTSRMAISWLPSACATNANFALSGDHAPDVEMKLIASKCESLVGPASFLITRPVCASATNSSISNRLRRAKNATSLPSGLTVGARFMSPVLRPVWRIGIAGAVGARASLEHRQVGAARRRDPVLRQRVGADAEHAADSFLEADAQRRAVDVDHGAVAPAAADVRPQRLPVAIREEARVVGELLDRREVVALGRVAQPHRRERIVASEREVLGHALDQPERQGAEPREAARSRLGDAVLEDVHELVAEHVIVVRVDAGERHDDAGAQPLGHAARALRQLLADHVRLLEVGMVGVEDHRLPVEGVTEAVRVSRVPSLGESAGVVHDERLGRIEVQIEVRRPQEAEVELLVLHLVATEVLRCHGGRRSGEERSEQGE